MKRTRNEHGMALMVAIIGLVVAGSLVTAFVAASVLDHRQAAATRRMGQAFAAAEQGLSGTVGNWSSGTFNGLVVNDSLVVSGSTPNNSGSYTATVKRLNNELFIVDVVGTDAASGARQRVGAFVKLRLLDVDIKAALTTRGSTRVFGNSEIHGLDAPPNNWTSCPPDSDLAGIRMPELGDIEWGGSNCRDGACVDGEPPLQEDPTVNDSTFFNYGDLDWAGLTAMANKRVPPGTYSGIAPTLVGGACGTDNVSNWGEPWDPTSACGSYFPILYSNGNLHLTGSRGQGILLVEGDLKVTGGFEFYGIVIVRGQLSTEGQGGHFNGAVLAANAELDENDIGGRAVVSYSSCAKQRALTSAGSGAMLRSRGWLYSY